jgi:uncharacterized membrane protein
VKTYLWEQLNDIQEIIEQQSALSNSIWFGCDITNTENISKHRVEALTDGVFAIVMTLLVLEVAVPHLSQSNVANELPNELLKLWPVILSYVTSFLILGMLWIAHHDKYFYIKRVNRPLLSITIFYLMSIAFIPFSTSLLGTYGDQQISVIIYGINIIIIGALSNLEWRYATKNHRLVESDLDPTFIKIMTKRYFLAPVFYLIAVVVSFASIQVSIILFILIPLNLVPARKKKFWFFLRCFTPSHAGVLEYFSG